MNKHTVMTTALAAACAIALPAMSAEDPTLAQIRAEIKQMKESYEARIAALEQRLQTAEAPQQEGAPVTAVNPLTSVTPLRPPPASALPAGNSANAFNPEISLILGGAYARLSQDPTNYRLQGFMPVGGEQGQGTRSFNLGESELVLSANVDPNFAGKLTLALSADNQVAVEEAYFQTIALANGQGFKGGRFLSAIGYLNSQHRHYWDFVDAPLAYQAMFGGQYKQDGLQWKWLAPTERFIELGLEAGNGNAPPGNDRNRHGAGSVAAFAHVGDDIGVSGSWRAGISYLQTGSTARAYTDSVNQINNTFTGHSKIWLLDAVYKWAPNGNATRTHFKLQGEIFRRQERGTLVYDTATLAQPLAFASAQSGGYVQGVYQFMPAWRIGLRYDRLQAGQAQIDYATSGLSAADLPLLDSYRPSRHSLMVDYSASEFSRLRLQFAQDKSRPGVVDNQIFLQYVMSLGAHGAHAF